jgi:hypothetical protein
MQPVHLAIRYATEDVWLAHQVQSWVLIANVISHVEIQIFIVQVVVVVTVIA